ncbi:MAG: FapA family protein, partial [Desulfobacterales bacterium]|nr:FapA family protein [Desulfobacterales bacterium]
MTVQKKPGVLILQSDDTLLKQAATVLTDAGWEVTCEKTFRGALVRLNESKKNPYALFISGSNLPVPAEGEDILSTVRTVSPLTQRMIMLPFDDPDILINAINKSKVNACITVPFEPENLESLSKNCFTKFRYTVKKEQLKRVTAHQNQQMFHIAKKLKRKSNAYKQRIEEKKARILKLNSKKRRIETKIGLTSELTLSRLIDKKGIQTGPDSFKNEFLFLCDVIKTLFSPLIHKHHIDPETFNYLQVLSVDRTEKERPDPLPKEETDTVMPLPEAAPGTPLTVTDDTLRDLVDAVLNKALTHAVGPGKADRQPEEDAVVLETDALDGSLADENSHELDPYFEISVSEDLLTASIKRLKPESVPSAPHTLPDILNLLMAKQISYGIRDDQEIETWLSDPEAAPMAIARGEAPEPGKNGRAVFRFETEYTNPGKIDEDGTIDFRDRGEIPFVKTGELMAVKTPSIAGKTGITVFGEPILVDEVEDPLFEAGTGTVLSEDGLTIYAEIDGQPHLDKLGVVSVSPELVIPGDVDFKTGNIIFNGNIIVKGRIKEGFRVKGINLQVQETEGAIIDISGDLNVSAGVTESRIRAQGNIYAKFISKSDIMGFADLNVSREIIDSELMISGKCHNSGGHIISSRVTAKLGIDAGSIGTTGSAPSRLKVGTDDHVRLLEKQIDESLENSLTKSNLLKDRILALEEEDQALYRQISEKANIQDRAQLDIKELVTDLKTSRESNETLRVQQITDEIKAIRQTAAQAEKELNAVFETQDTIAGNIQAYKTQLAFLEENNKTLVQEKKALLVFSQKESPLPLVSVAKTIVQDTVVIGPHSKLILREDRSRCRIQE